MTNKIFKGKFQKTVTFIFSILFLINCTTTRQIDISYEKEAMLSSKTIILHNGDRTFLFYNVKRNKKGIVGTVTSAVPFSNKSTELHIFINSDTNIPGPFPAKLNIDQSSIKKIEVYESNPAASVMLGSLILVSFVYIVVYLFGGPNIPL